MIPAQELKIISKGQRLTKPTAMPVVANADLPDGPIVQDMIQWPSTRFYHEQKELTGRRDGVEFTLDVQRHLLTAAGPVSWQYRGDGRMYSLPVVVGEAVYVASSAGTVTCLERATGAIRWRFMGAPAEGEILVNGQLESRWPVRNIVEKDGVIYFVAGRHVELNGGGWFWALNAESGAVKHQFQMFLPMIVQEPGTKDRANGFRGNRNWAANTFLFPGLAIDAHGEICLDHRKWNKSGSRPTMRGYWLDLGERTGNREERGQLDPTRSNSRLIPLNFAKWDGTVINPYEQFYENYFTGRQPKRNLRPRIQR